MGGGGSGKMDKVFCDIQTLFDAFLVVLDIYYIIFSLINHGNFKKEEEYTKEIKIFKYYSI